jgi:hypothetical protein
MPADPLEVTIVHALEDYNDLRISDAHVVRLAAMLTKVVSEYRRDSGLTDEQRYQARQVFEGHTDQQACVHCGGVHLRACRRVRKIEWHADGSVLKAAYWPDGSWDDDDIIWPEDAYEDTSEVP